MSIRPYTSEYTAVYSKWVGRYTAVYSRYTAVYWGYTAVYRGYTAVYTRYTAVFQDHGTGWVRGMHATLANETFLVQTPLPSNMCRPLKNPGKKLKRLMINPIQLNLKNCNHIGRR